MDIKKTKADRTTVTRDIKEFKKETKNIYETVSMISKRANQISLEMKLELENKLKEVIVISDSLEEIYENREQIELARFYEKLPHPTLIAIHEFLENNIYYRNPKNELDT